MKKFKTMAYIVIIAIIIIFAISIYVNASKNNEDDQKSKTLSELEYIETKFVELFNKMNNIEVRNYKITVGELSKETTESSSKSEEGSASGGSSKGGESGTSSSNKETGTEDEGQDKEKYELTSNGILISSRDVKWDEIKWEVENLYSSISTMTLDLYKMQINQDDILGFNKEIDNLTTKIAENNKQQTLDELVKGYEYIQKFFQSVSDSEITKLLIETKLNIFKAYSKLDQKNWQDIENDVKNAIAIYSKLLTNTKIEQMKQYGINKGYIMLNELQNSVTIQDEQVFLIKYKNLLEEINNI